MKGYPNRCTICELGPDVLMCMQFGLFNSLHAG